MSLCEMPQVHCTLVSNRLSVINNNVVRKKLCWDANTCNAVAYTKQRALYNAGQIFLCFESPTALFAPKHNLFHTM